MSREKKKQTALKRSSVNSSSAPEPEIELPEPQTPQTGFWILLIAGLVLLGVCTYFALGRDLSGWELTVFKAVNAVDMPEVMTKLAKALSNAVWGMLALIVVFLLIPKFRFKAWQYGVAAGATYVAVFLLEHIVDRARPVLLSKSTVLRAMQDGPGYPSGHEAVLAAVCLTVWLFVSWPWRIFVVLLLAAEAWARVFLGVHAPLDVVGGLAVAMVLVAILHLLPGKIRSFFRLM